MCQCQRPEPSQPSSQPLGGGAQYNQTPPQSHCSALAHCFIIINRAKPYPHLIIHNARITIIFLLQSNISKTGNFTVIANLSVLILQLSPTTPESKNRISFSCLACEIYISKRTSWKIIMNPSLLPRSGACFTIIIVYVNRVFSSSNPSPTCAKFTTIKMVEWLGYESMARN